MSPRREVLGDDLRSEVNVEKNLIDTYDAHVDSALRPSLLEEFIGQGELKSQLKVVLQAAAARGEPPDHLLFAGPPGLGKTSLAFIVAEELGRGIRVTSGPALGRVGDLAALLSDLKAGDVLFIDEIHRLPRPVEELLYIAMEDFRLDVVIGKGPGARTLRLEIPRFTLVGATTRSGMVSGPLRDRFGYSYRLDYYSDAELCQVVLRSARLMQMQLTASAADEIASRSRGTPRLANRHLRRVRDYAEVEGSALVTHELASDALELFGVDKLGLDKVDLEILRVLCERFEGRPVGVSSIAVSVHEDTGTLEEVYEPFLIQRGLLLRTQRGRLATERAYRHLGLTVPTEQQ
ncbi:Holliday junction branch migration DNA helicase RuvB [Ferrimicrobium sp.]|uniref:Holliday junction branch migration DNA helicase RuvB n=1 Tax=Ferrimicrobium sp. TaxID=2926050 RepID=UPI00262D8220|nr:Holliday junction branch migration DNA helicase RuvB [Ferrimicrobium sp.]